MTQPSCIFCKIYAKEIPAPIITQNEHAFVIKDIAPKAPVHFLIISKKHIPDVRSLQQADSTVPAAIMQLAQELAQQLPGSQSFQLVTNNGAGAGQSVFHLHFHFLSGS